MAAGNMIHSARASAGRKLIFTSRTHFQASEPTPEAAAATRAIAVNDVFKGSPLDSLVRKKSVPGGIRTPNLLIRSQLLYPVELQTQLYKSQAPNSKVD